MQFDRGLNSAWWSLRVGLGLTAFLAGLDKFFNILTKWDAYLSPMAQRVLPLSPRAFMHVAGVIEMIVGVAILTSFPRYGAYVMMVWLLAIAANLVTTGHYFDIAVRDVVMALGAYSLARLSEARERATARVPVGAEMRPAHA